jgi:hypothetical protein
LSLEEYVLLLKRFPKEMVTHVTRQGIRDHLGHMFHNAGQGEYIGSFMSMLEEKKLLSSLGACLANKEQKQAITKYLSLDFWKTKQEALDYLHSYFGGEESSYPDKNAIHFATEDVADAYYGGEKGNEIFVAYPSALIASEYYFKGRLKDGGGSDF